MRALAPKAGGFRPHRRLEFRHRANFLHRNCCESLAALRYFGISRCVKSDKLLKEQNVFFKLVIDNAGSGEIDPKRAKSAIKDAQGLLDKATDQIQSQTRTRASSP